MIRYDWIVMDSSKGGAFVCKRCGGEYKPALPCSIPMMVSMSNTFTKDHKNCKEKKDGENAKVD
ncbi:hypothetical protein MASR1M48_16890 [Lactococcus petauri]